MTVKTLNGVEYPVVMMDSVDRFHGNQLVFIGWDHHTSLSTANAFPLPPDMPFGALTEAVLPVVPAKFIFILKIIKVVLHYFGIEIDFFFMFTH